MELFSIRIRRTFQLVSTRYVVARGRSGVKNLILEPSEYAQDVSCAL